jgi:hypothetical protein
MTAKACCDVRESSAFWRKITALEEMKKKIKISTHPSHTFRYQYLDYYTNDMIEVMKRNNCLQLSETDPRKVVDDKYSKTLREAIIKKS